MSNFSRNVWDPDRRNRPETKENLTYLNLVEGEGKVPNQTRLDYALMTAAWHGAQSGGGLSYRWESYSGARETIMDKLGPWDPSDLDMTWEEASIAVKHASLAGIAELNPLWLYSDYEVFGAFFHLIGTNFHFVLLGVVLGAAISVLSDL